MMRWLAAPLVIAAVIGLMAALVLGAMLLADRLVPPRARQTVRNTGIQVGFGLFALAIGLIFGGLGFLSRAHERPGQLWPWLGLVAAFIAMGLYLCAAGARERVRWNRKGIEQTRLLLPPRAFAWAEITRLEPRGIRLGLRVGDRRAVLCDLGAEGIDGLLKAADREGVPGVTEVRLHLPRDRGNRSPR